jgi:mannose-6-phosphate isomerase-like protein (cupin superfamily)
MKIKKLKDCPQITAGDNTTLREILHPERDHPFAGRYSLAHAVLPPGQASLKHRLKTDEVYYVLAGKGEMHVDNESAVVEAGDTVEIPPGSIQWITNTGDNDLAFLCLVDPAWTEDDEEILE